MVRTSDSIGKNGYETPRLDSSIQGFGKQRWMEALREPWELGLEVQAIDIEQVRFRRRVIDQYMYLYE
eukprot:SAG31_NODE_1159_length_9603_cov_8.927715_5_plen_68_part_00